MATAEYKRRWRAARGARTGQPGRPPAPCPSAACWKRHQRRGEPHDVPACHQAYLDDQRRLYRQRAYDIAITPEREECFDALTVRRQEIRDAHPEWSDEQIEADIAEAIRETREEANRQRQQDP